MTPLVRGATALLLMIAAGCKPNATTVQWAKEATGGNPQRGEAALVRYGCIACHTVDGIRQSQAATVGPPLTRMASRTYLAGNLQNTPETLIRWIQKPREIHPDTAMPDVGVTDSDAQDMAAYLYTFK